MASDYCPVCPICQYCKTLVTHYLLVSRYGATLLSAVVMKQVDQQEQTLLPEARMKAPIEAARPTQTVDTSDLTYRMVSNTAMPAALNASKSQAYASAHILEKLAL